MSSNAKVELMKLCRDINNGYFSPSTMDDIIKMAQLYRLCGKKSDIEDEKKKIKYELFDKKETAHQIYLCHIKLIEYELTNDEKLRCVREIIGAEKSLSGGYCLWLKHFGAAFEARDLLFIAKNMLKEVPDCSEKELYETHIKKIFPSVLFGFTKKYLPIPKIEK